ncbi:MAG TPA: tRNA (N6-threonylcarbamoyladenosine(37)-N6)-methyltransferase TrmO [Jatrophihabitans sp.]|nr:tRNA (N6-threonylcarbamoyladenosine(37)-N6)-methyltransferase TrmO [Jatrophihabitans sp.]
MVDQPEQAPGVELFPIGYVQTGFADPADAPSQAAEAFTEAGRVVLHDRFAAGLTGLRGHPYLWLITWLHAQAEEQTTELLVVPRSMEATGGRTGVYATRSPHRPNRLGLSLVRVEDISGNTIEFSGVDLVSGTPVLDIKPWYRGIDGPPEGDSE